MRKFWLKLELVSNIVHNLQCLFQLIKYAKVMWIKIQAKRWVFNPVHQNFTRFFAKISGVLPTHVNEYGCSPYAAFITRRTSQNQLFLLLNKEEHCVPLFYLQTFRKRRWIRVTINCLSDDIIGRVPVFITCYYVTNRSICAIKNVFNTPCSIFTHNFSPVLLK